MSSGNFAAALGTLPLMAAGRFNKDPSRCFPPPAPMLHKCCAMMKMGSVLLPEGMGRGREARALPSPPTPGGHAPKANM